MATPENDPNADLIALEAETDHAARNTLALVLADRRTPGLPDVLIRLIRREDLRDHRGTLVHALGDFDCTAHLHLLAELVAQGNWEVAHEAFQIIDAMQEADVEEVGRVVGVATGILMREGVEPWRRTLLEDLREMWG